MDIALLNVKITVQKNETVVVAIGNHKNNLTDYHTCFATVSGEGGSFFCNITYHAVTSEKFTKFCKRTRTTITA